MRINADEQHEKIQIEDRLQRRMEGYAEFYTNRVGAACGA